VIKIKICGLFREADAEFANEAGPDFAGFVFAESRRRVSPAQAARLRSRLREGIVPVGVFVNAPPEEIAALYRDGCIGMAQLHGGEDALYIRRLKTLSAAGGRPPVPVIKALRMAVGDGAAQTNRPRDSRETAPGTKPRKGLEGCEAATAHSAGAGALAEPRKARFPARSAGNAPKLLHGKDMTILHDWMDSPADYLLLDNGAGSGKPFDWMLLNSSLLTLHSLSLPWFLAGGVSLENIDRALSYRPFAVDVSSGAETNGVKDREKMITLVKRVREERI
jgi:phosphoribosylanthranilate isomerase